jgi:starch-binding outer membrane protein SusE/F
MFYMKNIIKLFITLLAAGSLFSCEKKISMITAESSTAPVLSANKTTIPLSFVNKDNEAITLSWTNPNYVFSTGNSSQNVSYALEIDTAGANFTNPNRKTIVVSNDLGITLTQNDLNDYLLNQLTLQRGMVHNIEMRVTARLANNALPVASNVLKFAVTPYSIPPKVAPPTTGKLYIVGDATPGGWNNPVPVPSQQLTQISPTLYEITLPLIGDKSYLFLPLNGDWGTKFGTNGASNTNNVNGDDLKNGGGDIKAPPTSGNYKIQVDFQRGKFTVTKL